MGRRIDIDAELKRVHKIIIATLRCGTTPSLEIRSYESGLVLLKWHRRPENRGTKEAREWEKHTETLRKAWEGE